MPISTGETVYRDPISSSVASIFLRTMLQQLQAFQAGFQQADPSFPEGDTALSDIQVAIDAITDAYNNHDESTDSPMSASFKTDYDAAELKYETAFASSETATDVWKSNADAGVAAYPPPSLSNLFGLGSQITNLFSSIGRTLEDSIVGLVGPLGPALVVILILIGLYIFVQHKVLT